MRLPQGWSMTVPEGVDLKQDWGEYHSTYKFSAGTFTAERTFIIHKNKVPLNRWEDFQAFRRAMHEDWARQILISPKSKSADR